jgi:hypothetical protein
MKTGRTIAELAKELDRQQETQKDYLAPAGRLAMTGTGAMPMLLGLNGSSYPIQPWAHGQIAEHGKIPKAYYDRMLTEAPDLLATNVNTWFQRAPAAKKMVRTLDGFVRAFLSNRYRRLDNVDLARTALPILAEKNCEVRSCEVTDRRLYIKATLPAMQSEVKTLRQVGDVVEAGIVISNSEVGAGAVKVEPLVFVLRCTNGLIAPDSSLRRYHIGRGADFDDIREMLTDQTKKADDQAFWLKVRDIVRGAFDADLFNALVSRMNEAAGERIESGKLPDVVEMATDRTGLREKDGESILRHLIEGGDLTRWGLCQAITRTANDEEDYEQATALERAGGVVLELKREDWDIISRAKN